MSKTIKAEQPVAIPTRKLAIRKLDKIETTSSSGTSGN